MAIVRHFLQAKRPGRILHPTTRFEQFDRRLCLFPWRNLVRQRRPEGSLLPPTILRLRRRIGPQHRREKQHRPGHGQQRSDDGCGQSQNPGRLRGCILVDSKTKRKKQNDCTLLNDGLYFIGANDHHKRSTWCWTRMVNPWRKKSTPRRWKPPKRAGKATRVTRIKISSLWNHQSKKKKNSFISIPLFLNDLKRHDSNLIYNYHYPVHTGLGLWYWFLTRIIQGIILKKQNSVIGFYASSHQTWLRALNETGCDGKGFNPNINSNKCSIRPANLLRDSHSFVNNYRVSVSQGKVWRIN